MERREREFFINIDCRATLRVIRGDHGKTRVSPDLAPDDCRFLDTDEWDLMSDRKLEKPVCVCDGFLSVSR